MRSPAVNGRISVWTQKFLTWLIVCGAGGGLAQQSLSTPSSETTYQNRAMEVLIQRAREISKELAGEGLIPEESFVGALVELAGQSTHPSGRVLANCCEYWFHEGDLASIRRTDLFKDKGPETLIRWHLTNEVLKLSTEEATNRVLHLLRSLSYDTNGLLKNYRLTVRDDLLDAEPPYSLRLIPAADRHFVSGISQKEIKIQVSLVPLVSQLPGGRLIFHTEIDLLATTGELYDAVFLPNSTVLKRFGARGPEQITLAAVSDFNPPVYISVSRKLEGTNGNGVSLVREAWRELQEKLGAQKANCILVCDNLNEPQKIAAAVQEVAGGIPWAGVSSPFRSNLPFDRARIESLAQGKRGVSLLAIFGGAETRIEMIPDLGPQTAPTVQDSDSPAWEKSWEQFQEQERVRLAPRLDQFLNRIQPPGGLPDHVLFVLRSESTYSTQFVIDEMNSRLHGEAQMVKLGGFTSKGVNYLNGAVLTNAMVVLRLSGFLPLRDDIMRRRKLHYTGDTNLPTFDAGRLRALQATQPRRILSPEAIDPVRTWAQSFCGHPLEFIMSCVREDEIRMLSQADKMEAFEIKKVRGTTQPPAKMLALEGYQLVAQGNTLEGNVGHAFLDTLPMDLDAFMGRMCLFDPVVDFRVWQGKESAHFLVCFQCDEIECRFYDANGKLGTHLNYYFSDASRTTLLQMALETLPKSEVINAIHEAATQGHPASRSP